MDQQIMHAVITPEISARTNNHCTNERQRFARPSSTFTRAMIASSSDDGTVAGAAEAARLSMPLRSESFIAASMNGFGSF
ncbi:hypothetical protein [Brevifollis gellanilyticus]|uniref:hypothetical protein n=1 Tax=Brevifollis gellanilyticus TaxID=748831 RepID=UPI001478297B|nr:hypothetical protein [Brevifollis gellanilyticus]